MVLASVAPTVYAICQRFGFDFVLWSNPAPDRVTSTAGNAIFLGSYLVIVWPVTLALAAQARLRPIPLVLLTAQTLAIVFTGSVGVANAGGHRAGVALDSAECAVSPHARS